PVVVRVRAATSAGRHHATRQRACTASSFPGRANQTSISCPGSRGCTRSMKTPRRPRSTTKSCSRTPPMATVPRWRKGIRILRSAGSVGSPSAAASGATFSIARDLEGIKLAPRAGVCQRAPGPPGVVDTVARRVFESGPTYARQMSSSASGPLLPTLIVTGGASDGLQIPLESPGAEKIIGSGPSSHLRLTNRNVDTLHARIAWEDAGVVLSDVGSAAGTFVNGERVENEQVLSDGDRISIGPPGSPESVKLLVRVPGNLAAAAALPVNLAPPPSPAPSFSDADEDPLVFADPAVETFTPAFAPPSAETPADGPAIVFEESPSPPAPTVAAPAAA